MLLFNVADIFTKCLGAHFFEKHRLALGFRHRDFLIVEAVLSLEEEETWFVNELEAWKVAFIEVCCEPESSLSVESETQHQLCWCSRMCSLTECFMKARDR